MPTDVGADAHLLDHVPRSARLEQQRHGEWG